MQLFWQAARVVPTIPADCLAKFRSNRWVGWLVFAGHPHRDGIHFALTLRNGSSMDPALFVRRNTAIVAPPLVPEIRLHLATEVTPIWQATEETLARSAVPPPFWAFAWAGGQALARYLLDHPEAVERPRGARFRRRLRARRDRRREGRRRFR